MRLEYRIAKLEQDVPNPNPFAHLTLETQAKMAREFLIGADGNEDPAMIEATKQFLMEYQADQEVR